MPKHHPMQRSEAHLHPTMAAEVAASAREALTPGCEVLLAIGRYAPDPARAHRVLVLALDGGGVRTVADAWMDVGDEKVLRFLLAGWEPRLGATDAVYATPWKLAWTTDTGDPFQLWDASGALLRQVGASFWLRPDRRLDDVAGVHGFLAADWVERGVRLLLAGGGVLALASVHEEAAAIDPTYDGIDLLVDASWVTDLARSLASALGVPVSFDEVLL